TSISEEASMNWMQNKVDAAADRAAGLLIERLQHMLWGFVTGWSWWVYALALLGFIILAIPTCKAITRGIRTAAICAVAIGLGTFFASFWKKEEPKVAMTPMPAYTPAPLPPVKVELPKLPEMPKFELPKITLPKPDPEAELRAAEARRKAAEA